MNASRTTDTASDVDDLSVPDDVDEPSYLEAVSKLGEFWDWFWFTPQRPHTLCVLRILTGAMLCYCHVVLASDLLSFLGDNAWVNNDLSRELHDGAFGVKDWARSYLWNVSSPTLLYAHQILAIVAALCFCLGLCTRVTLPLSLFLQLMFLHRLTGTLFGLDQIVTYVTMYLVFTPCNAKYSLDSLLRVRLHIDESSSRWMQFLLPCDRPSVAANIGTRLLQLHLCVIYLFGGLAKARGETWWNGEAVWLAVANFEYQSMEMTWISRFPALISALSNATLFWEVFYCALVWPRVTRPFVIGIAFAVHASIACFLGMMTFGTMMMIANGVFIAPTVFQSKKQRREDLELRRASSVSIEEQDVAAAEREVDRQLRDPNLTEDERRELQRKKERIREAATKVKTRYRALKKREAKYEARVKKLREREDRIKEIVAKRRSKKRGGDAAEDDNGSSS